MCARFGPPLAMCPRAIDGGYPTWRWGVIWSNRDWEGIEWSFGCNRRGPIFHFHFSKGETGYPTMMFRLAVWRLFTIFARVQMPFVPHPFEVVIFTNPPIFRIGRSR